VWKNGYRRSIKCWFTHITGKRVGWFVLPLDNADALADSVEFMRSFFENAPLWYAFA
jgi:hypothetical protein